MFAIVQEVNGDQMYLGRTVLVANAEEDRAVPIGKVLPGEPVRLAAQRILKEVSIIECETSELTFVADHML